MNDRHINIKAFWQHRFAWLFLAIHPYRPLLKLSSGTIQGFLFNCISTLVGYLMLIPSL